MDSFNSEIPATPPPVIRTQRPPRIWKFWGTCLWGLFVFAAMFVGQIAVVAWFVLWRGGPLVFVAAIHIVGGGPLDVAAAIHVVGGGLTISLSVIMGLPAVLAALWIAIRVSGTPFAEYLALRWTPWSNLLIGVIGLFVLVMGWDLLSRATGREVEPGFMGEVLKSARADGALWLLAVAFCVAAPISEEFFARGLLYRGWSESFLGPVGAILLSSLVWTALRPQYDLFFFGEVFSIGLLLGYLRYRFDSPWLTVIVRGLNNLAAVVQTMFLAGHGSSFRCQ